MRRLLLIVACLGAGSPARAQPPLTPATLETALAANPQGAEADRLAERVREWFGGRDVLVAGPTAPKIDGVQVAWAVETPQPRAGRCARPER